MSGEALPSEKITRSTTAIEVAKVLRQQILRGQYKQGQFIRQEMIAQELGVSRLPVREALAQLEAEGLVTREKFRGAVVSRLSTAEINEIYELRLMLEPYLLRHAMAAIGADDIALLREIIHRSCSAEQTQAWAGLNVDFHKTLYEKADRPLALHMLDNLLIRADRYLKMQQFLSERTRTESDAQHQRILELVASRDVAGAEQALVEHIEWNAGDVRRMIAEVIHAGEIRPVE